MHYVYILKWEKYYIWSTNDLERRLQEHKRWNVNTTRKYNEIKLIWYFEKENQEDALKLEKQIKKNGHTEYRINHETFIKFEG